MKKKSFIVPRSTISAPFCNSKRTVCQGLTAPQAQRKVTELSFRLRGNTGEATGLHNPGKNRKSAIARARRWALHRDDLCRSPRRSFAATAYLAPGLGGGLGRGLGVAVTVADGVDVGVTVAVAVAIAVAVAVAVTVAVGVEVAVAVAVGVGVGVPVGTRNANTLLSA